MPPEPHGLVADLNAAPVQQILDVPEREQEPDGQHDRKAEDLRDAFKTSKVCVSSSGNTTQPPARANKIPLNSADRDV